MNETEIHRYDLSHSVAVSDDDLQNEFTEHYARYGIHNQIHDWSLVYRNKRRSQIQIEVRTNGLFPLSGEFEVHGELRPVTYVRDITQYKPR